MNVMQSNYIVARIAKPDDSYCGSCCVKGEGEPVKVVLFLDGEQLSLSFAGVDFLYDLFLHLSASGKRWASDSPTYTDGDAKAVFDRTKDEDIIVYCTPPADDLEKEYERQVVELANARVIADMS